MSTLDSIRDGIGRAWESISEGWSELYNRASHAVTRFHPTRSGDVETAAQQVERQSLRWGLLAADVRESEQNIEVRLEAPGMEPEHFDIAVLDNRVLVIQGEKRVEREETQGHVHMIESAYGRFERSIPLPAEVDDTHAKAKYKKGVLRVTLPKRGNGGAKRRISIQED